MKKNKPQFVFYRVAYVLFVLIAIYYIISGKDYLEAAATLGIALIFDPFKPEIPWNEKPTWQKSVLITHLILSFGLLILGIFIDKNW